MTIATQMFDKHRLKVGIVEPDRTSVAEKQFGNHVPAVSNSNEKPIASQQFGKHISVTMHRLTSNCSVWWSLFGSPEVIKGKTRENAKERNFNVQVGSQ